MYYIITIIIIIIIIMIISSIVSLCFILVLWLLHLFVPLQTWHNTARICCFDSEESFLVRMKFSHSKSFRRRLNWISENFINRRGNS